jgi:predicted phosphate transport protein (TIGR00153 family)
MNPIIDLFASSPMKPMRTHMQKVQECVAILPDFFDAVFDKDWEVMMQYQKLVRKKENEADELKKTLRINLPTGLFMPVSRIDLLNLLTAQDKIANKAKDVAGLVTGRKMEFPPSLEENIKAYLNRSLDAAKQADKAIQQLDELLESGFKGREVKIVEEMITVLDEIENDVDVLQIKIRQKIFDLEEHLSAVNVIFFYKLIEWIGDISDLSQEVGARLELFLAR